MSVDSWINIAIALITNAVVVWSVLYKFKRKNRDAIQNPNIPEQKHKRKIVVPLMFFFSFSTSVYNIFTYVNEPILPNVPALCIGVSIIFFNFIILIFNLLFDRLLNTLKEHVEVTRDIADLNEKGGSNVGRIIGLVESLTESYSKLKKDVDKLKDKSKK